MSILDKVKIGIISHHRPHNVEFMHSLVGTKVTWYVGEGEKQDYEAESATVVEGGGMTESRNRALEDAWKEGKAAVLLADDIRKIQKVSVLGVKKNVKDISFVEAVEYMYDNLEKTGLYLAGVPPTDNEFFFNEKSLYSFNTFVIGDFIVVKKCDLHFDTQFKTKDDYDYTLQHIQKYGGALRCNSLLISILHYGNKGGVVDIRTPEFEQDAIARLKKKWGTNTIKDNPRRPNEILLRVKKDKNI